ncbi:MAG: phosphatase PAP2 family protein [Alphaproteobacteria bacterium]|nr:phosphatase PAP2 family protein [Alphaproteobacteria bacterium]
MSEAGTTILAEPQRPGRALPFVQAFYGHAPFLLFALVMMGGSEAIKSYLNGAASLNPLFLVFNFILFWMMQMVALLPMLFFQVAVFDRAGRPLTALAKAVKTFFTAEGRFATGFAMMTAVFVYISGFSALKAAIPQLQPFAWDQTFERWDRLLHFGHHPWEWLQPVLGYGPVTMLININYNFWFLTLSMFWLYFAFVEKPGRLRTQAIAAYMLTWSVGGVLLAVAFSSAGPCYYGLLGLSPDPYAGLMAYLRDTNQTWPVWALALQDGLWQGFVGNADVDLSKGISAMPSMHNAQALLLVLSMWNKHRLARNLAIGHGVLVFLGSIHLGWHYAVDGYLAFAIAGIAWIVAGIFARHVESRRQPLPITIAG